MLAKIRGEPFPGIPFATYNLHPYGPHASDPSYAGLLELVCQKAGMLVKKKLKRRRPGRDITTLIEEMDGQTRTIRTWHTPQGALRSVEIKPSSQPAYIVEHFIKDDADMAKVLSAPFPGKMEFDAADMATTLAKVGEMGVVYVDYPDPMYSAASLFDFEDFAVRWLTDPGPIEKLIDHLAEGIHAEVEAMAQACAGWPILFYSVGPEVATPPMMPPRFFTQTVTRYQKELVALFHRHGCRVGIHCHGRIRQVLDEFLEIGIDTLEPIEPPDQGDIKLKELLEKVAGRICLMGYIQDQDFSRAAPGEMRRKVGEIAKIIAPTDRYIMMPTCTPFESPASSRYLAAYAEWIDAAAELLP